MTVAAPVPQTTTPPLAAGTRVRITQPSPVFLSAKENQTPLEVLSSGMVVSVIRTEGEWYFIQFESPRWGRRVGFVKSTAVDHDRQPMDLSVPEAVVPLDLSVPDSTLTPLNLSVPEAR